MKARWKILIAVGIFMLVFTSFWLLTIHIQPENELETYKQALRAQGEKLEISEVLPPPVPPASNGVDLVRSAFALFPPGDDDWSNLPPAMQMIAPGRAMICSQQPEVRGGDFTNSWPNVMAAMEANRPITELLVQAAGYPSVDFQIDYQKGFEGLLLPHLAPLKRCARSLSAATICDLHNGDAGSATANLCALLSLVEAVHDERFLISQLVRIAMASIGGAASWELLQSTNVTDADLVHLQSSWEKLDFLRAAEKSCELERAAALKTYEQLRTSNSGVERLFGSSSGPGGWTSSGDWLQDTRDLANAAKRSAADFLWRTSWSYDDEQFALRIYQTNLEALRSLELKPVFLPVYAALLTASASFGLGVTNTEYRILKTLDLPEYQEYLRNGLNTTSLEIVRKLMEAETGRQVVVTAIALKRFQLKHGHFPHKLSELTPDFLTSVPLDPMDGKPLQYRANANGTFLLYSIGLNGVDDGGDPSPVASVADGSLNWLNDRARDWVWPQPATEAEVKYFEEHPPK